MPFRESVYFNFNFYISKILFFSSLKHLKLISFIDLLTIIKLKIRENSDKLMYF